MKTEREIEKTKDVIRALDAEQKQMAKEVLFEESGVELTGLRSLVCDEYCHWPMVCASQERLDRHCGECRLSPLWEAVFGKAAG